MVMKKYPLFILIFLLIAGVFASYSIGNPESSIGDSYSKGENIQGWINLSINNELATTEFKTFFNDSEDKSINLLNLLKSDSRNNYNCTPSDCEISYTANSPSTQKTFTLDSGESRLIALKIGENINQVDSVFFRIQSDASINKNNQIKIDFLDDGSIDTGNNKTSSEYTTENYGCYSSTNPSNSEYGLTSEGYCQEIELDEAPGFSVGANIKRNSGTGGASVSLYDKDFNYLDYCDIDESDISDTTFSKAYCNIDYLVLEKEKYYVCVSYDSGSDYWIEGYNLENGCGFYGLSAPENPTSAYSIFAIPKKFGSVGTINITDAYEKSFTDIINQYLNDKYSDLDCSTHDCIIPIKITSGVNNQNITLKDLDLRMELSNGAPKKETNLYDSTSTVPTIKTNNPKIYLDNANLTIPNTEGIYNLELKFKNQEVFSKNIEVRKGISIYSIYPTKTAKGLPTNFVLSLDNGNITEYNWDFGDGTTDISYTSNIQHTYSTIGQKSIIVSVKDNLGTISSKTFNIQVGSAESILGELIDSYINKTDNLEENLLDYNLFSVNSIKESLDLKNVRQELNELKTNYTAITDGDEAKYQALLSQLLEINIPTSISQTESSDNLIFYPKKENLDLYSISLVNGENYDSSIESDYKDSILGWNLENIQMKMSIEDYSGDYGFGNEFLIKTFDINIKDTSENNSYLFIGDNLNFDNSSFEHESGYYYKELSGEENIKVYSEEDINFENLPIFVSPSISSLNIVNGGNIQPSEDHFNWALFLIIAFGIIILGILVYVFLKKWYAKKYESHLFKNKNDLYNMVTYIQNAKKQGMDNDQISKNLRKAKWGNEKITYVMRKYAGKNTGMPQFSSNKSPKKRF